MISIKEMRNKKGLKQYEAAKKLNISKDYLSALENNKKTPSLNLIYKMSELYDELPEKIFLSLNRTICKN
jgi:putative transcriptional regulator